MREVVIIRKVKETGRLLVVFPESPANLDGGSYTAMSEDGMTEIDFDTYYMGTVRASREEIADFLARLPAMQNYQLLTHNTCTLRRHYNAHLTDARNQSHSPSTLGFA